MECNGFRVTLIVFFFLFRISYTDYRRTWGLIEEIDILWRRGIGSGGSIIPVVWDNERPFEIERRKCKGLTSLLEQSLVLCFQTAATSIVSCRSTWIKQ